MKDNRGYNFKTEMRKMIKYFLILSTLSFILIGKSVYGLAPVSEIDQLQMNSQGNRMELGKLLASFPETGNVTYETASAVILCGPSGFGKSLFSDNLVERCPEIFVHPVWTTDRPLSAKEIEVGDEIKRKRSVPDKVFSEMEQKGDFVIVFEAHQFRYGLTKQEVDQYLNSKNTKILLFDVSSPVNRDKLKQVFKKARIVYIVPPHAMPEERIRNVLRKRYEKRGFEESEIGFRVEEAIANLKDFYLFHFSELDEFSDLKILAPQGMMDIKPYLACRKNTASETVKAIETLPVIQALDNARRLKVIPLILKLMDKYYPYQFQNVPAHLKQMEDNFFFLMAEQIMGDPIHDHIKWFAARLELVRQEVRKVLLQEKDILQQVEFMDKYFTSNIISVWGAANPSNRARRVVAYEFVKSLLNDPDERVRRFMFEYVVDCLAFYKQGLKTNNPFAEIILEMFYYILIQEYAKTFKSEESFERIMKELRRTITADFYFFGRQTKLGDIQKIILEVIRGIIRIDSESRFGLYKAYQKVFVLPWIKTRLDPEILQELEELPTEVYPVKLEKISRPDVRIYLEAA